MLGRAPAGLGFPEVGLAAYTDTFRHPREASPLQRLLRFYPEHRAMASGSAIRKCQFGAGA
jgi:hypothetical protein